VELEKKASPQDIDSFIASADSLMKAQDQMIDALCAAHPTMSTRFMKYRKATPLCSKQVRFANQDITCQDRSGQTTFVITFTIISGQNWRSHTHSIVTFENF
jgi:hypothetical protein